MKERSSASILSGLDISLRPARPDDQEFLRVLFENVRESDFAFLPLSGAQKTSLIDMQFHARESQYRSSFPGAEFLLIWKGDVSVGSLILDESEVIHLVDIAVLAEHRGQGIGTALVGQLLERGKEAGKSVVLSVAGTNRARSFYERLNFRETGQEGPYIAMRWDPRG